jgi:hypothetical protein
MDPRERADEALARARARGGAFVVTPDDAVSPMDAANTVQIPRAVVDAADQPESTMVIPAATVRAQMQQRPQDQNHQQGRPQQGQQQQGQQQQGGQYQSGQHQPVPRPGHDSGQYQPVPHPGHNSGQYQPVPHPGHDSGQHQPVPRPGHQSGQHQPVQSQARQKPPVPEEQATPRQLDGLVPTTQQPGTQRSMLSRRLDGQ